VTIAELPLREFDRLALMTRRVAQVSGLHLGRGEVVKGCGAICRSGRP
jgi:hypothetical protein